jgi:hypothetical protein
MSGRKVPARVIPHFAFRTPHCLQATAYRVTSTPADQAREGAGS